MFNKYYQDELTFLREMGAEYAHANPKTAHLLSDRSADPDVERLMEAFSFISGQLRQKLDDELPELTHTMLGMLWPHYLRPVPSQTIIEFEPRPVLTGLQTIEKGVELNSRPVEGTVCKFQTCYETQIAPIRIEEVAYETPLSQPPTLRIQFRVINGAQLSSMNLDRLRLFFHGDAHISYELYLRLMRNVTAITVQTLGAGRPYKDFRLRPDAIRPVGFAPEFGVLPYPDHAFPGYRLVQEYFALPEKFLFMDVEGLAPLAEIETEDQVFEIIFLLEQTGADPINVRTGNVRLHCTPAVNLFSHEADPITIDHKRTEYRARPTTDQFEHYEIYSVDSVFGIMRGTAERVNFTPFYDFTHPTAEDGAAMGYHQTRIRDSDRPREEDEEIESYRISTLRESPVGYGTDTYISFVSKAGGAAVPTSEIISLDLTCSNRHLPEQLGVNDISVESATSPEFATFQNIIKPTGSVHPPLDGGLHWRLISHLSLNFLSLINIEAIRSILELYNFHIYYDQQAARENQQRMQGLVSIQAKPSDWILKGAPLRGRSIEMAMNEDDFAGEGDMFLFASILNEFFALYATMNSFTRLTVRGVRRGEVYQWPRRLGQQILL